MAYSINIVLSRVDYGFESKRQHFYFAKKIENTLKMSNKRIELAT